MKMYRSLSTRILLGAVLATGSTGGAFAQGGYPTKPIRVVIGFAPGGPADIIARLAAPRMSEALGQQLIIETRGGAGGTIGMEIVAKAPPDGYTIGLGSSGNLIVAPHLYPKIGYNVARDLAPIGMLGVASYVIAVNPSVPARSAGELVKIAKSKTNALSYGTSGNGSSSHVAAELFRTAIGAEFVHVPYKGTGPALTGAISGEIDMVFGDLTPALPHAQNNRLRLLAVLGSKRSPAAPKLPTVTEAGIKMPPISGRYAFVAPAGTPRDIINRLHAAMVTALKSPDVQQRFEQSGFEMAVDTPDQLAATLKTEGEIIGGVIRRAGIKPDL
jgi:tripartite-type tricarboxylate transporter receptor subunit TctC